MRYFSANKETMNSFRQYIINILDQPNGKADEPWAEDTELLALSPHEYDNDLFAPIIANALENEVVIEITENEYFGEDI
jgi:hypothetical protein